MEDLRSEYERIVGLGVEFISPPNEVTYGVNKGALAVYFKGPDNIRLEMISLRDLGRKSRKFMMTFGLTNPA